MYVNIFVFWISDCLVFEYFSFLDRRYSVFRSERDRETPAKLDGGGVLIVINKSTLEKLL